MLCLLKEAKNTIKLQAKGCLTLILSYELCGFFIKDTTANYDSSVIFSGYKQLYFTNKTDRHDIAEISRLSKKDSTLHGGGYQCHYCMVVYMYNWCLS